MKCRCPVDICLPPVSTAATHLFVAIHGHKCKSSPASPTKETVERLSLFILRKSLSVTNTKGRCPVDICLFFHKERTSLRMSFLIIYSSSGGVKADMIQRYLSREEVAFQVM